MMAASMTAELMTRAATTIRATTRTRTTMGSRIRMGMGTATREGTNTMENIITIMVIHIMAAGRPGVSALVCSAISALLPARVFGYPPAAGRFVPPAVYIERKETAQPAQPATASQANYWHYCRSAEGYYPYVKECPDGWEQVAPTPQAGNDDQE